MKKLASIVFIVAMAFATQAQIEKMAVVSGKFTGKGVPAEIELNTVANGETQLHSKVKVANDGSFGFCFTPEYSGFYTIGGNRRSVRLYLTPGKQTSIAISDTSFWVLNKKDKENKYLANWENTIHPLKKTNMLTGNYTFVEVFPTLAGLEQKKNEFIASVKTKDAYFNTLFKSMVEAEFELELYHFLFMPRSAHPKETDFPEIYNRVSAGKHFTNTNSLSFDFGMQYVNGYLMYLYQQKRDKNAKSGGNPLAELCINSVSNDTIIGQYLLKNTLVRAKSYDQAYQDLVAKYGKYLVTAAQKKALANFELTIRSYGAGEQAIDFTGSTVEGKKIKLSDLKGKVVLVDVWATWCAPCKKEIPALQKLEEEMKGLNVAFVSYSVDEIKDTEKWKKMVETEKLGGIQLMGDAAFKSPICIDYKINSIPRFLVFDKNGKIVSIDAPRPSNPDLKAILTKLL